MGRKFELLGESSVIKFILYYFESSVRNQEKIFLTFQVRYIFTKLKIKSFLKLNQDIL